jgi:preprotein translocase subunit YajC
MTFIITLFAIVAIYLIVKPRKTEEEKRAEMIEKWGKNENGDYVTWDEFHEGMRRHQEKTKKG